MDREGNITIFLTLEDVKENILHLPQITLRVFYIFLSYCNINMKKIQYNSVDKKAFNSQLNKL